MLGSQVSHSLCGVWRDSPPSTTVMHSVSVSEPCWSISDVKSSALVCSWLGARQPKSQLSAPLCHATLHAPPTCFQPPSGLGSSWLSPFSYRCPFALSVKPSILSHNSLGVQMTIVMSHFSTRSVRVMEHWCNSACIRVWPLGSLSVHLRVLTSGKALAAEL